MEINAMKMVPIKTEKLENEKCKQDLITKYFHRCDGKISEFNDYCEWKNGNGAAIEFDLTENWQRCFCHVSLGRNDSCRLSLAPSPRFNSTFPLKRLNCFQLFISETS